jgi:hypothetical protein
MRKLKGYRIRVTIDIPIWEFDKDSALEVAKKIAVKCHSASKIVKIKCIKVGLPDNRDLFSEDYNPSKRIKNEIFH